MRHLTATIITLVLITFFGCEKQGKGISLKYSLQPNRELTYQHKITEINQIVGADTIYNNSSKTFQMLSEQKYEQGNESGTVAVTEKSYWYHNIPENSSTLDTVNSYRKDKLTYNLSSSGEISNLIIEGFISSLPDADILDLIGYEPTRFPENEIFLGDSWTQNIDTFIDGEKLVGSTIYQFSSLIKIDNYECALIEYTGGMVIPFKGDKNSADTVNGIEQLNLKGVIYFAYKDGIVIIQNEKWYKKVNIYNSNSDPERSLIQRTSIDIRLQ